MKAKQLQDGIACMLVGDLGDTQPSQVEVSLDARMTVKLSQGSPASSSTPIEAVWGTHTLTAKPLKVLPNCPVHAAKPGIVHAPKPAGAQPLHVGLPCAVSICKCTQALSI